MKLDHILLGLFTMRPWSGYDIGKWFAKQGRFYRSNTDQSQIYRVLRRMEAAGWISYSVDSNENRPDSKVYSLLDSGREEFLRWIRTPYVPPTRFQDAEFRVRFVYGGSLDRDSLHSLLKIELEARRNQVLVFRNRDRAQSFVNPIPELNIERANQLFELSHIHGMQEIDAWIIWLEEMIIELGFANSSNPTPPKE